MEIYFNLLLAFNIIFASLAFKDDSYDELWKAYKVKYRKEYIPKYEGAKRSIWLQNVLYIAKHNLEAEFGMHSFKLELNNFSDMTEPELNVYRKCFSPKNVTQGITSPKYFKCDNCYHTLPDEVDWRKKDFVTPVKDQKDCGSCWAFSATGALEGQNKAKKGYLISLSEQNLIDCSFKEGNQGCDGGWMDYAFKYVMHNHGINSEEVYPYVAKENYYCKFNKSDIWANISHFLSIHKGSERDLQTAVAHVGPVSVAIDAMGDKFMQYKEGIYYDETCTTTDLNHAVLVVGYGTQNGKDYWIVKNSWGTNWGMNGYILMARNARNQCGIASHAVYPVI